MYSLNAVNSPIFHEYKTSDVFYFHFRFIVYKFIPRC